MGGAGGGGGGDPAGAKAGPRGWRISKHLSAEAREELALAIRACAMVGVGMASAEEIDAINILQATLSGHAPRVRRLCSSARSRR